MTEPLRPQVEVLVELDEEQLFEVLGSDDVARREGASVVLGASDPELAGRLEDSGALPRRRAHTREELIEQGHRRFSAFITERRNELQDAVCPHWQEHRGGTVVDIASDVAGLVAVVMGASEPVTSIVAISVILVRRGLDKFCADWSPPAAN